MILRTLFLFSWLLWLQMPQEQSALHLVNTPSPSPRYLDAFETRQACTDALDKELRTASLYKRGPCLGPGKLSSMAQYWCLPHGVHPREAYKATETHCSLP